MPNHEHPDASSSEACKKWSTEQAQNITRMLSDVFKATDEATQIQSPSRLLKQADSPAAEVRKKLNQIKEQIAEYQAILQLGSKRIDNALEAIKVDTAASQPNSFGLKMIDKIKRLFLKMR